MFDGGEQFHQFIASSRTSLPIPLSFPLHGNPSFSSSSSSAAFDPYAPPLHHHPQLLPPTAVKSELRSTAPWSNDELLALLKARSSMEIWFPDFTWEHVSRKLGELGFKRSGEQCKEKFEEESRHFNIKNYRILSELDEFYHDDQEQPLPQPQPSLQMDKPNVEVDQDKVESDQINNSTKAAEEENLSQEIVKQLPPATTTTTAKKKRKRRDKFEMLKGFCEAVVKKMMSKQEELHNKLIEDIVKMDQEHVAREEAWKRQEMERIKTETEIRSKEQKSAAERQATIIKFLKQFTASDQSDDQDKHHLHDANNVSNNMNSNTNSNNNSSASCHDVGTASMTTCQTKTPSPSSPSSLILAGAAGKDPPPQAASAAYGGDLGKRWPRDEVLALINLRCKMSSNVGEEGSKGPLWERISQGMMELGYKRNAKRCKEKWENINKYFRKTKDSSKKRSVNSRTCPYFHQLSSLYSDGTIVAPTAMPENLQY